MEKGKAFLMKDELKKILRRRKEMDVTAVETLLECMRISDQIYSRVYDPMEKKYHISKGKFSVLIIAYKEQENGTSPSQIADELGVSRATITGLISRLAKTGHLSRGPSESDRRMQVVKITEKGKKLMENILPDHYARISHLMRNLSVSEREELVLLLKKIH